MQSIDSRSGDLRFIERLASIEISSRVTNDEVSKLRGIVHDLVTHQATLGIMAEEARDSRAAFAKKLDEIVSKIDPLMVAMAQGATTIAMHLQQCTDMNKTQDDRHRDNQRRFRGVERSIYIATGGGVAIGGALTWFIPHLLKGVGG